jgi:hypothetical protein
MVSFEGSLLVTSREYLIEDGEESAAAVDAAVVAEPLDGRD